MCTASIALGGNRKGHIVQTMVLVSKDGQMVLDRSDCATILQMKWGQRPIRVARVARPVHPIPNHPATPPEEHGTNYERSNYGGSVQGKKHERRPNMTSARVRSHLSCSSL